jgi:exodeoxyribonuclease VII small subunit
MSEKIIKKPSPSVSYEEALTELEGLLAKLESGQLPLDSLLKAYERGAELLGFCRGKLEVVEQQFKVLEGGALKPWGGA